MNLVIQLIDTSLSTLQPIIIDDPDIRVSTGMGEQLIVLIGQPIPRADGGTHYPRKIVVPGGMWIYYDLSETPEPDKTD